MNEIDLDYHHRSDVVQRPVPAQHVRHRDGDQVGLDLRPLPEGPHRLQELQSLHRSAGQPDGRRQPEDCRRHGETCQRRDFVSEGHDSE